MDRPAAALLFSAAMDTALKLYGQAAARIVIFTQTGVEFRLNIPPGWEVLREEAPALRASADCVAEVLATIVEEGKRLTRAALMAAMERRGRPRAESTVSEALADLTRLGLIDNRQDVSPKGYGLISWGE